MSRPSAERVEDLIAIIASHSTRAMRERIARSNRLELVVVVVFLLCLTVCDETEASRKFLTGLIIGTLLGKCSAAAGGQLSARNEILSEALRCSRRGRGGLETNFVCPI